jgi:hypothetical protein
LYKLFKNLALVKSLLGHAATKKQLLEVPLVELQGPPKMVGRVFT